MSKSEKRSSVQRRGSQSPDVNLSEQQKQMHPLRPKSSQSPTTPFYSNERLFDEITALKKQVHELQDKNKLQLTQIRRMTEEQKKKDSEYEQLLKMRLGLTVSPGDHQTADSFRIEDSYLVGRLKDTIKQKDTEIATLRTEIEQLRQNSKQSQLNKLEVQLRAVQLEFETLKLESTTKARNDSLNEKAKKIKDAPTNTYQGAKNQSTLKDKPSPQISEQSPSKWTSKSLNRSEHSPKESSRSDNGDKSQPNDRKKLQQSKDFYQGVSLHEPGEVTLKERDQIETQKEPGQVNQKDAFKVNYAHISDASIQSAIQVPRLTPGEKDVESKSSQQPVKSSQNSISSQKSKKSISFEIPN
ncbi:hypothetical protein MIR68_010504 [Amoeboaphelidium protococcarum]|nr:hypothetical protein MIR68_010504 [Amoeboaphelidium protococcarum]